MTRTSECMHTNALLHFTYLIYEHVITSCVERAALV